jgi:hypothetical protein
MVGKTAASHGEHPGTQGCFAALEVFDALGYRQPGLPRQVFRYGRLFPAEIAKKGGLQGVEENRRRPLLPGDGRPENLVEVLNGRIAKVAV